MTGRIIRMVKDENKNPKGFGFILGEDGKEYFFHRHDTNNWNEAWETKTVSFTPGVNAKDPSKLRASDITVQ